MEIPTTSALSESFYQLTPERILEAVETLGKRATGRVVALNSMENRVYDVELEDESRVVAKFYRPGRWSRETILDEHAFLADLAAEEVPVVPPLACEDGTTLGLTEGILFAVFPRSPGRPVEELGDDELRLLGSLLARLHIVGSRRPAPHRMTISPASYGRDNLDFLNRSGQLPENIRARYMAVAGEVLQAIEPLFAGAASQRIHGDCHPGNLLWNGRDFMFVDFDDMLNGPPVQDVWLLVPGRDEEGLRQRKIFLEGYSALREFDEDSLKLVEALRALRYIHYTTWVARRWEDAAFKRVFPNFGTPRYWQQETQDLMEQLSVLKGYG